jgi:hypothetical protein
MASFVRDVVANKISIYIDGVFYGSHPDSSPGDMEHNFKEIIIGGGIGFFDGLIDEVAIYNRALNAGEVYQRYSSFQTQPVYGMSVSAYSPVDITVTDPDGLVISKTLNQIPWATYIEIDLNGDGEPDDQVNIFVRKMGDYLIAVTPEPGASPTDTYTIEVSIAEETLVLANNVPISDAPSLGYIVRSEGSDIRQVIATTLDFDPDTSDTLAQVNTPATLAAILVDEDGQPISYAEISFLVDGQPYSDKTGLDGVASCEVTISAPGVYEVTAEFAGDTLRHGSATTALLTIYDPEGGFVTGGGWIDSPGGAYAADPTLTGRANFGFVSKYKKGATEPTGQTEFQFKVADLNFHSDTYEWLIVAGARAQYKGTGTINGAGNYGFMLTAIDAKLTPSTDDDKFRIKIWDKDSDTTVYDNQMGGADDVQPATEIGGGNIVIHKG